MKFIKRFIKYYLPIFLFISATSVFLLVYMKRNHEPVLRFLIGDARVHSNLVSATVKEDGVELSNAKVFEIKNGEQLLVYSPDSKASYKVIIINKVINNIGQTNSGKERYKLLFDKYLIQTDGAYGVVYASSVKWELDPKLIITDTKITYRTQKLENKNYVDVNHEIIFKDK